MPVQAIFPWAVQLNTCKTCYLFLLFNRFGALAAIHFWWGHMQMPPVLTVLLRSFYVILQHSPAHRASITMFLPLVGQVPARSLRRVQTPNGSG